jgi:predicted transcriptional regulator
MSQPYHLTANAREVLAVIASNRSLQSWAADRGRTMEGVHQTCASLRRKGLIEYATRKPVTYRLTPAGRAAVRRG